jgi:signal transduction histidine kinase
MTPHRTIDRWVREHPHEVDRAIALGLWFALVAIGTWGFGYSAGLSAVAFVAGTMQTVPLAWRRSRPAASAAVVVLGSLVQVLLLDTYLLSQLSVPITVYTLAAYGRRWQSFAGLAAGFAGAAMATLRFGTVGGTFSAQGLVLSFLGLGLIVLLAWTFGDLARTRRLAVRALEDRARRLEVERLQERELAAADERNHIAREMHDIVAHSLSVIITQADGARYASAADPDVARQTLETISGAGRKSLREMRRLLGVLRSDEQASVRPLPTLGDIPGLVDVARRAGLEVESTVTSEPRRELPAGAELTAYRAVQEGLTNVLKHAGPAARSEVALEWTSQGLTVSVTDDGRGAAAAEDTAGSLQGLVGMAERAALYDGRVETGPLPGGGFAARIFIPYTED